MFLPEICIKRPIFASICSLFILTLGIIFFTRLQIRGVPDIELPIITVSSSYEGADASYMEQKITIPIENALKTLRGLDSMTSQSSSGNSVITLAFDLDMDIDIALNDARSKVASVLHILPTDMQSPAVSKMDIDNFPSFWLTITSDKFDKPALTKIVNDEIITGLNRLKTVGNAVLYGGRYYTMLIEPDPVKLFQYKISPIEIAQAVLKQSRNYPSGAIKTEIKNFTVVVNTMLSTPEEFGNIILRKNIDVNKNGSTHLLRLKDIAKVYLSSLDSDSILRYNGSETIAVGLILSSKANVIDLSKDARLYLKEVEKSLPKGVNVNITYDSARPVEASINGIYSTIFEALILVTFVTYLFFGSFKLTLIPFVTIPISLISTFSVMYLMGFSINLFTMLAMILAIGLVIDDSIVMLENIFRYYEKGHSPMQAAFLASKEISFAIIAMTITLATVFLPIGFIQGFVGKLFIEFAWTLAFAVLFSGFVSLTLTPMMTSRMLSNKKEMGHKKIKLLIIFDNFMQNLQKKYHDYLLVTMNNKGKLSITVACSIVILIASAFFVEKTFVPQEDDAILQLSFKGPEGTNSAFSLKSVEEAENILRKYPEIDGFFEVINGASAFAFVPLKNWSERIRLQNQVRDLLNKDLRQITGMSVFALNPRSMLSGGGGYPIEFTIETVKDYSYIEHISLEFIELMKKTNIFINVHRDYNASLPTLRVVIDRDKAAVYDVDIADISNSLSYLINGKRVGDFMVNNDIYQVFLQYNKSLRREIKHIKEIFINSRNKTIPIEAVAEINESNSVNSYNHYNALKAIKISSDLASNVNMEVAQQEINNIANKLIKNKEGIKLRYLGEIKQMNEAQGNIAMTFFFALIFIYFVLCMQFESLKEPLLILFSVPFSITGGLLSLLVFKNSLNLYSGIGLITLIGLITKNAIMIIEFATQLLNNNKKEAITVRQAIIEAAILRLRPIIMTTAATILGAIPLILSSGAGAQARHSIGLVIVGGMFIGSIFTMFVIPNLYDSFKKIT